MGIDSSVHLDYVNTGFIVSTVYNDEPYILGLNNHPTYKDHWVTGYGYMQNSSTVFYAIVNDGWGSTGVHLSMDYTDFIIY